MTNTTDIAAVTALDVPRTIAVVPRRSRPLRRRRLGPRRRIPFSSVIGPLVVLAVWSIASATGVLDWRTLPAPWTVVTEGASLWRNGTLAPDIVISLQRAALGFLAGASSGIVLALISGLSRVGEALIDSTVQLKRAIPSLGMIPLFILWLGIGEGFKVAIIAIGVFVPIYLNLSSALTGLDNRYVELAEVLRLSRWQFLRKVVFPGALPGLFVGLRLGVVGSWLSLVVLEQINATSGLGYMMFQATNYGQTDIICVGLAIYGIFGLISDRLVRLAERRVLSWRRTPNS
jgi:sulfonate transport system permease protein